MNNTLPASTDMKDKKWEGMTLDTLMYERAVALSRVEIERHRLAVEFERTRKGNILFSRTAFSRFLRVLSFTDIVVIGVRLWRSVSPIFRRNR